MLSTTYKRMLDNPDKAYGSPLFSRPHIPKPSNFETHHIIPLGVAGRRWVANPSNNEALNNADNLINLPANHNACPLASCQNLPYHQLDSGVGHREYDRIINTKITGSGFNITNAINYGNTTVRAAIITFGAGREIDSIPQANF